MATKRKPVDAVVIGVGWAGSILGKELAQSGLKVVGLERGGERQQQDFTLPMVHDQLKYDRHLELFENLSRTTLTFRNSETRWRARCAATARFLGAMESAVPASTGPAGPGGVRPGISR